MRNFPEQPCELEGKSVSSCFEAVSSIADTLGLAGEVPNIQDAFRLGRPRQDGKPRPILVKTVEKTTKLFLSKSRLLKQATHSLSRVYLREDLPPEVNKKLAEMRKRLMIIG